MNILKSPWFKCITCLFLIAVISGALLALLNDVLAVSPEMRTSRAITKIYGEEKEYATVLDVDNGYEPIIYDGVGSVNKVYSVSGDLLFQTTGYQGYKNGTITLWIKTIKTNEKYSIDKILLQSFEKQTLMSKLTGEYYGKFNLMDVTETYASGNLFSATNNNAKNYNPVSGATYSATAACNAVNCVIKYLGGER